MNKKKLFTFGSLALVGTIGVGATLAYLSDTAGELKNTFTVGENIEILLQENKVVLDGENIGQKIDNDYIYTTQDYGVLEIGVKKKKNPHVYLSNASNDAYVFIKASGIDEFLKTDFTGDQKGDVYVLNSDRTNVINSKWKLVQGEDENSVYDGIYAYYTGTDYTNF